MVAVVPMQRPTLAFVLRRACPTARLSLLLEVNEQQVPHKTAGTKAKDSEKGSTMPRRKDSFSGCLFLFLTLSETLPPLNYLLPFYYSENEYASSLLSQLSP